MLQAAIQDVLADRVAEPVGGGAELGRGDLEIAGREPDQVLLAIPAPSPFATRHCSIWTLVPSVNEVTISIE